MAAAVKQPPQPRLGVRIGKLVMRALDAFLARQSLVATTPFLERSAFPWVAALEAQSADIRAELNQVMQRPQDIPAFHEMSPDQVRISRGDNWKTFVLRVFGHRIEENCRLCPHTAEALDALPGLQNAWFSILAPGYHIPPHRGPTKAVVRCHLGLLIPKRAQDCWLRVSDQRRHWRNGECLLFDDTYEHEVRNDSDEARVVLFLDVDRPLNRCGTLCRQLALALVRTSAYVKRPLANLERWNRRLGARATKTAAAPAAPSPSAAPVVPTAQAAPKTPASSAQAEIHPSAETVRLSAKHRH